MYSLLSFCWSIAAWEAFLTVPAAGTSAYTARYLNKAWRVWHTYRSIWCPRRRGLPPTLRRLHAAWPPSSAAADLVTVSASTGPPELLGRMDPFERWPGVVHWELPALGPSLIDRALCFGGYLTRWLRTREFQVIHFRSIFEGLPVLRSRNGAALVFEVNGLPSIELKYRYPGSEDDRELMRKIEAQERACIMAADRIVTPSAVTRDFLVKSRGAVRERIAVIPNGADTKLFRPREVPPASAAWRLLYFGTLSPWQGVDLAIRAVAQVDGSITSSAWKRDSKRGWSWRSYADWPRSWRTRIESRCALRYRRRNSRKNWPPATRSTPRCSGTTATWFRDAAR